MRRRASRCRSTVDSTRAIARALAGTIAAAGSSLGPLATSSHTQTARSSATRDGAGRDRLAGQMRQPARATSRATSAVDEKHARSGIVTSSTAPAPPSVDQRSIESRLRNGHPIPTRAAIRAREVPRRHDAPNQVAARIRRQHDDAQMKIVMPMRERRSRRRHRHQRT